MPSLTPLPLFLRYDSFLWLSNWQSLSPSLCIQEISSIFLKFFITLYLRVICCFGHGIFRNFQNAHIFCLSVRDCLVFTGIQDDWYYRPWLKRLVSCVFWNGGYDLYFFPRELDWYECSSLVSNLNLAFIWPLLNVQKKQKNSEITYTNHSTNIQFLPSSKSRNV